MAAARRHGTVVSYDLNYRPSLWSAFGGQARAREVNRRLARQVDVLLGNEEDFTAALGFEVPGVADDLTDLDVRAFAAMIDAVVAELPHLSVVATTLRAVRSATRNDWGAVAWAGGTLHRATHRPDLEILDRVGGGDSFASGLVYGLLQGFPVATALEYGSGARSAGHDDTRRHVDGHPRGGREARSRRNGTGRAMSGSSSSRPLTRAFGARRTRGPGTRGLPVTQKHGAEPNAASEMSASMIHFRDYHEPFRGHQAVGERVFRGGHGSSTPSTTRRSIQSEHREGVVGGRRLVTMRVTTASPHRHRRADGLLRQPAAELHELRLNPTSSDSPDGASNDS